MSFLFALPPLIVYVLFCLLGGALGFGIGRLIAGRFSLPRLSHLAQQ